MSLNYLEATGQQALDLLRDIIKKLGNWPLLEGNNWKESDFDWIDFTIETKNIGLNFNNFLDFETLLYPEKDKLLLKYQILVGQNYKPNLFTLQQIFLSKHFFFRFRLKNLKEIFPVLQIL